MLGCCSAVSLILASDLKPDKAPVSGQTKKYCGKRPPAARLLPMVHTELNQGAVDEVSSVGDAYVKAYRTMLLARRVEKKFPSLYRTGKIRGGVFLGRGQEALSVA